MVGARGCCVVRFRRFTHLSLVVEHKVLTTPEIPMMTCRTVVPQN